MTAPDGLAPDWERWRWPAVRNELLSRRILAMAKPESVTARAERLAAERTAAPSCQGSLWQSFRA